VDPLGAPVCLACRRGSLSRGCETLIRCQASQAVKYICHGERRLDTSSGDINVYLVPQRSAKTMGERQLSCCQFCESRETDLLCETKSVAGAVGIGVGDKRERGCCRIRNLNRRSIQARGHRWPLEKDFVKFMAHPPHARNVRCSGNPPPGHMGMVSTETDGIGRDGGAQGNRSHSSFNSLCGHRDDCFFDRTSPFADFITKKIHRNMFDVSKNYGSKIN